MNELFKRLDLQLFAGEGTGGEGGGGEGAAPGVTAADAGQQRLLELGVPADKLRRRAKVNPVRAAEPVKEVQAQPQVPQQDAAAQNTEVNTTDTPARMSWEEIMADPEYNKQMQSVVQARLKNAKASEETLGKLTPALELLARKYNLDAANMDYDALTQAINDDNQYYEDKAIAMGVDLQTAKKLDQQERDAERQRKVEADNLQQQRIELHIQKLRNEGEILKKTFPNFDLHTELQNPAFARMTAPNVGISVADAYYAVHREEIQRSIAQATAQQTAQKITNSIQSGQMRPVENGTSAQAPSVSSFDYRNLSKQQRADLRRRILEADARGEKIYPGR